MFVKHSGMCSCHIGRKSPFRCSIAPGVRLEGIYPAKSEHFEAILCIGFRASKVQYVIASANAPVSFLVLHSVCTIVVRLVSRKNLVFLLFYPQLYTPKLFQCTIPPLKTVPFCLSFERFVSYDCVVYYYHSYNLDLNSAECISATGTHIPRNEAGILIISGER